MNYPKFLAQRWVLSLILLLVGDRATSRTLTDSFKTAFQTTYYLQDPIQNAALTQTTYTSLNLALEATRRWQSYTFRVESMGALGLNCRSCTYIEIPEAYFLVQPSASLSVYAGRKKHDWSRLDESWKLGLWQPRFIEDGLRPIDVALTGFHFSFRAHSQIEFAALLSPLFIPERGTQVNFRNSYLTRGDSPWFMPPPAQVSIYGKETEIDYRLSGFDQSEIIFNPALALQSRLGKNRGAWAVLSYAYKPRNQLEAQYRPYLKLDSMRAQVDILPYIERHHVAGIEAGWKDRRASYWLSLQYENPIRKSQNASSTYIRPNNLTSDTLLGGAFGSYDLGPLFFDKTLISAAWIQQMERRERRVEEESDFSNMQRAVGYASAARGRLDVTIGRSWTVASSYTHGLMASDSIMSFEAFYHPPQSMKVGLTADFLSNRESEDAESVWGRFRGNDRVQASLSYVF